MLRYVHLAGDMAAGQVRNHITISLVFVAFDLYQRVCSHFALFLIGYP
jgi:hypothetical protein